MEFSQELIEIDSIVTQSKIQYFDPLLLVPAAVNHNIQNNNENVNNDKNSVIINHQLDVATIHASNHAAGEYFLGKRHNKLYGFAIQQSQRSNDKRNHNNNDTSIVNDNNNNNNSSIVTNEINQQQCIHKYKHLIDSKRYKQRFLPKHDIIKIGDLIVIQESFGKLNFVYVTANEIYSNKNGNFHHNDFINKPYGSKIRSKTQYGFGYCYILKPTPELWTRSLNHRTQIIHELDQSQIIYQLYIKPGMNIIESGTGSAATSYSILRAIAPSGHLFTYEFNDHRAQTAHDEFTKHNVAPQHVTVYHRDVCSNGFTDNHSNNNTNDTRANKNVNNTKNLPKENTIDAILLDLPEPWVAIPYASKMIRSNCRIASYSPCIEQVQRTVQVLEEYNFHTIQTFEYRLREYYVDNVTFDTVPITKRTKPSPHNTDLYNNNKNNNNIDTNENEMEQEDVDAESTCSNAADDFDDADDKTHSTNNNSSSDLQQQQQLQDNDIDDDDNNKNIETDHDKKRRKVSNEAAAADASIINDKTDVVTTTGPIAKKKQMLVARPFTTMRGHTAFLTFATSACKGTK